MVKLTDKEVQALASKIQKKDAAKIEETIKRQAKQKLPQAKKIIAELEKMPDEVMGFLYRHSFHKGISPQLLARALAEKQPSTDRKDYEADVILAAHNCTTLEQLCRKLGV